MRKTKTNNFPICPICGFINEKNSEKCAKCGASFKGIIICPKCGSEEKSSKNFCSKCYSPLKKQIKYYSKTPKEIQMPEENLKNKKIIFAVRLSLVAIALIFLLAKIKTPAFQFLTLLPAGIVIFILIKAGKNK